MPSPESASAGAEVTAGAVSVTGDEIVVKVTTGLTTVGTASAVETAVAWLGLVGSSSTVESAPTPGASDACGRTGSEADCKGGSLKTSEATELVL